MIICVTERRIIAIQKITERKLRIQYAALPYRRNEAGEIEVLLITSRTRRRWIIPKGWPIKGLRPGESAAREAYEEAGVRGAVSSKPIGRFTYHKLVDEDGRSIVCEVMVFPLAVRRRETEWPEMREREIRWVPAGKASTIIDEDGLRPLLDLFAKKMAGKWRSHSQEM